MAKQIRMILCEATISLTNTTGGALR